MEVDVAGELVKPWETWFVDVATDAVCGTAVTAGPASRECILAALRAAITLDEPYGPPGGLPERVRIDRGQGLPVHHGGGSRSGWMRLPGYRPHLKGTVETLNGAAEKMFSPACPATPTPRRWTTGARPTRTRRR